MEWLMIVVVMGKRLEQQNTVETLNGDRDALKKKGRFFVLSWDRRNASSKGVDEINSWTIHDTKIIIIIIIIIINNNIYPAVSKASRTGWCIMLKSVYWRYFRPSLMPISLFNFIFHIRNVTQRDSSSSTFTLAACLLDGEQLRNWKTF